MQCIPGARRGSGSLPTVPVDWSYIRVGEEAGVLIAGSMMCLEVDLAQARALDKQVFAGYLVGAVGLEDSGYHHERCSAQERATGLAARSVVPLRPTDGIYFRSLARYVTGVNGCSLTIS